MCQEHARRVEGGENGPLSERPIDELRAVQAALDGEHHSPEEARYAVRVTDGRVVLFETGDLATVSEFEPPLSLTKSELWRANLETVVGEIERRDP